MKKVIIILVIVIVILLLIFTPLGFLLSTIPCMLSPSCGFDAKDTESVTQQAISSKNIKLCNKLPKEVWFSITQPRGDCYAEYAIKNKDLDVCFKMQKLKLSGNPVRTNEGNFGGRPLECYIGVAVLTKNSELCGSLGDIEPRFNGPVNYETDRFLLMCYGGVAEALNDKSICDNLKGDNKVFCLIPFSDESICDEFTGEDKRSQIKKKNCKSWVGYNNPN